MDSGGDGAVLFGVCVCVCAGHAVGCRDQSGRAWCKIVKSWRARVGKSQGKTQKKTKRQKGTVGKQVKREK